MCAISEKHPIWSAFWLKRSYGDISLQARPISFHIFPCCCCTVALIPPPCLRYAIAPIRVLNDPNIMNKIVVYINIGFFENRHIGMWWSKLMETFEGGPLAFFKTYFWLFFLYLKWSEFSGSIKILLDIQVQIQVTTNTIQAKWVTLIYKRLFWCFKTIYISKRPIFFFLKKWSRFASFVHSILWLRLLVLEWCS